MRIMYYFLNYQTNMFQWQKYHIIDEMSRYNVEIKICSPLEYECTELANQEILKQVISGRYDLFMTCLTEKYLYKETLYELKSIGIPTLLFCPDNLTAPYNHKSIARDFDLVWLTSKETEYLFQKWGANTVFLPYAANPYFLKPVSAEHELLRIGFIGTPHGSRIERINMLLKNDIPVTIHTTPSNLESKLIKAPIGSYVSKFVNLMKYPIGRRLAYAAFKDKLGHRELLVSHKCLELLQPVPLEQLSTMNNAYALILSFTDADSSGVLKNPVPIVNLRNFEIPMAGGLQITRYTDELASYFENDKEIILCKDDEEFKEKALFYLNPKNDNLRLRMKVAARKRAEKEHTWMRRFGKAFHELGLNMQ